MEKEKEVASIFQDMHSSLVTTRDFLTALLDQEETRLKYIEDNIKDLTVHALRLDDHNQNIAELGHVNELTQEEIKEIKAIQIETDKIEETISGLNDIKKHLDSIKETIKRS